MQRLQTCGNERGMTSSPPVDPSGKVLTSNPHLRKWVAEMAALGVARISLGGHLSRAALAVARRAARELKEHGTCAFAREGIEHRELNELMARKV